MAAANVELLVDPCCPWCWLTTLWLYEAETVRSIAVSTGLFSLAEVNREGDEKRDSHNAGERALRVMVAVRRAGGEQATRAAYLALGEARHERDQPLGEIATLRAAAAAAGLDPGVADDALADDNTLTELLDAHAAAVARGAFGVPSLSLDGAAPFFGPVIDGRVAGEEAGALWDIVAPALAQPHLFELKRPRTSDPGVGRYRRRATASS